MTNRRWVETSIYELGSDDVTVVMPAPLWRWHEHLAKNELAPAPSEITRKVVAPIVPPDDLDASKARRPLLRWLSAALLVVAVLLLVTTCFARYAPLTPRVLANAVPSLRVRTHAATPASSAPVAATAPHDSATSPAPTQASPPATDDAAPPRRPPPKRKKARAPKPRPVDEAAIFDAALRP